MTIEGMPYDSSASPPSCRTWTLSVPKLYSCSGTARSIDPSCEMDFEVGSGITRIFTDLKKKSLQAGDQA